jgi:hypothetical protein
VIAGDGQACALHAVRPRASGEIITVTQLAAAAPYLYVALAGGEIRRYPLASE